jgi:hypothetical protein
MNRASDGLAYVPIAPDRPGPSSRQPYMDCISLCRSRERGLNSSARGKTWMRRLTRAARKALEAGQTLDGRAKTQGYGSLTL